MSAAGPRYAPIGPWWTVDGPSLRVPDGRGGRLPIWSAGGSGPAVLLVPAPGRDHEAWLGLVAQLPDGLTVHAVDLPGPACSGNGAAALVAVAAAAVGAAVVVADRRGIDEVTGPVAGGTLVLREPPAPAAGSAEFRAVAELHVLSRDRARWDTRATVHEGTSDADLAGLLAALVVQDGPA